MVITSNIFEDSIQGSIFTLIVVLTPLSVLATALRFLASHASPRKLGAEDWFALGALLFYLGWITIALLMLSTLDGKSLVEFDLETYSRTMKEQYAGTMMFMPNQLCAKFSILLLYNRIFGVNRVYKIWIKILAGIQVVYTIVTSLVSLFECTPVSLYWDPLATGHCINVGAFLAGVESTNSFVDFAMVILAMFMLRELQVDGRTKLKLGLVFVLGGLAGVIGFIKIGLAFNVTVQNQLMMGLWSTVQQATSIFCCCVITYKPLFTQFGLFSRLSSWIAAYGSRSQLNKSHQSDMDNHRDGSHRWIDIEGASGAQRGLVSTDIGASKPESYSADGDFVYGPDFGHQMKTVRVQQVVEHV